MSKFLALGFDADGHVWRVEYSEAPDSLPAGQVACTEEQFVNCHAYTVKDGVVVSLGDEAILASARQLQVDRVNAACQAALKAITIAYPDDEVVSWDQQLAEATAYAADPTASVPLIDAIAMASCNSVPDLVASILKASSAYKESVGAVIGKRRALTAQIKAAATVDDVRAINW